MCSPVFYPVFYTSYSAFIFHFCGLCERTFPPRNVHKSRPRSPIWYLFSLSQGRNDYPITQIPIIFPSPLSELLNLHHSHATYNLVLFVCCTYLPNKIFEPDVGIPLKGEDDLILAWLYSACTWPKALNLLEFQFHSFGLNKKNCEIPNSGGNIFCKAKLLWVVDPIF